MKEKKSFTFPEDDLQLFPQPEQTRHLIQKYIENQLSGLEFLQLWRKIQPFFKTSSEPQRLLVNLLRIGNRMFSPATFFKQLDEYEQFRSVLFTILEASDYLTDILNRHPEYFYWLCTSGININHPNTDDYLTELDSIRRRVPAEKRFAELIKAFKRRELLRIGSQDLLQLSPCETIIAELSFLADSILQTVLDYIQTQVEEQLGTPQTAFCIIALGKLGGNELNYSSDVDLIFLYERDGETKPVSGKTVSHTEFFNRMADKLTRFLGAIQEGECIYRVDTRLRPDGDVGLLARSLSSYVRYYETRGKLWERQMLVKARPVAGNLQLGQLLLKALEPFVFPRTYFTSPLQEIVKIKNEIEKKIAAREEQESNIKLMAGGIRDIEFITQALQLLNGGLDSDLRHGATLSALRELHNKKILTDAEYDELKKAYIFFRRTEHFQQLASGKQTHLLPASAPQQQRLALYLSTNDWHDFFQQFRSRQRRVRHHFEQVFGIAAAPSAELQLEDFLTPEPPVQVIQKISQHGFQNPFQIYRGIYELIADTPLHPVNRSAEIYNRFIEQILAQSTRLPAPDQTLTRLLRFVHAYGSKEALVQLLIQQPVFFQLILDLCVKAPVLIRMIQLEPRLSSLVFNPTDELILAFVRQSPAEFLHEQRHTSLDDFLNLLIQAKNRTWLIIGLTFLKEQMPLAEVCKNLSKLADWVLTILVARLLAESEFRYLRRSPHFGLFALGKLGGREINFGSDLDLIFIYSGQNQIKSENQLEFTRFLQRLVQLTSQITPLGFLYRIDLRLRPEGENSPLVSTEHEYLSYFSNRAQLWEKQALLKFRFIAGNKAFGIGFQRRLTAWLHQNCHLDRAGVAKIVAMRHRIESEKSRLSQKLNIKITRGGILDVEFLAQIAGLIWPRETNLHLPHATSDGLKLLKQQGILSRQQYEFVRAHYWLLREIEAYLNISLEKTKPEIPSDPAAQKLLIFCLSQLDVQTGFNQLRNDLDHMRAIFVSAVDQIKAQL